MKKMFCLMLVTFAMACVNSAFAFAKYVDITTTYAGGDVTDFPVLVKITTTTPTGFYSDVKNAGADLKFADASGNGDYPYEIDTWNASGDSYIWVKLPKLSAGMTFRMYYGDEEQTTQTTKPTDVWTGYDLVCHVNDASDSATPTREGALNPNGSTKTDGMVGKAHGTPEATPGAVMVNTLYSDNTAGVLPDGQFSYSFWVRPNVDVPSSWSNLCGPKNGQNADAWGVNTGAAGGTIIYPHTAKDKYVKTTVTGGFPVGTWRKIDVTMDGALITAYVDGVQLASTTLASAPRRCWVKSMGWGGSAGNGTFESANSFAVDIDECRIFSTVADSARVAADYQTVVNVATFLSFSDPHGEEVVNVLPQGVIVK